MTNQESGVVKTEFSLGDVDYAQGGTLMVYLNDAFRDWHSDLAEALKQSGFDSRLVPDLDEPIKSLINIEKLLAK